ncbi:putative aminotransferase [Aspergillus puulaauensis]|uniref:Putative secondary metabolism biosynthetic enzyme n=1 Tax=Aspergillus puulaauensis TaxID=1220207 RepID=A0A7R7XPV6_9EURO|nr:putative secondary metabolism biosynthetic enzyme [Aspergillus puulaauensis]BCS25219.1 putative secondary metabolism biosynthetic enzyme [Aspergillus puulaauensis]
MNMAAQNKPRVVSQRAQTASDATSNNLMWDIMNDLWCPSANPEGYVNVGVAENALMHDELLKFLNKKLELPADYLTYNDGGGGSSRLKKAICHFLNHHMKPIKPLEPSHLIVTNGVSPAIEHVSWAFADPGEGILLGRPYYGTFIPDISLRPGTQVVEVAFDDVDPFSIEAVAKYEKALLQFQENTGKNVRGLMLCHPHNPLGRCYPRETIIGLMKLCQQYQIHLISDEIYALSVFENRVDHNGPPPVQFESALSIDITGIIDPELVHILWGMSKDFGANGIRVGVLISQANPDVHLALKSISLYSYSSGIADHLTSLLLEDKAFTDAYIKENQKRLGDSYAYTVDILKGEGIEHAPGCNAAFFLWVNLGKRYRELHPGIPDGDRVSDKVMQQLLQRRVFLASGELFGAEKDGWFRIVFTHPREYLKEALDRIYAAIRD